MQINKSSGSRISSGYNDVCAARTSKNGTLQLLWRCRGKRDPFDLNKSIHHQMYIKMDDMGALQK